MEPKSFTYKGTEYSYTIRKNARVKRVSISLSRGGKVVVTKPTRIPLYMVDAFVRSQAEWIAAQISKYTDRLAKAPVIPSYKESKERARVVLSERVRHFAPLYGQEVWKIAIRNQKTRWGSCSSNGTLSFNYHLLFVSPDVMDYVVVHEICHLIAPNHSMRFWKLVAQQVPNYKQMRAELRNNAFSYEG